MDNVLLLSGMLYFVCVWLLFRYKKHKRKKRFFALLNCGNTCIFLHLKAFCLCVCIIAKVR